MLKELFIMFEKQKKQMLYFKSLNQFLLLFLNLFKFVKFLINNVVDIILSRLVCYNTMFKVKVKKIQE